jgi:hypothetical protein
LRDISKIHRDIKDIERGYNVIDHEFIYSALA